MGKVLRRRRIKRKKKPKCSNTLKHFVGGNVNSSSTDKKSNRAPSSLSPSKDKVFPEFKNVTAEDFLEDVDTLHENRCSPIRNKRLPVLSFRDEGGFGGFYILDIQFNELISLEAMFPGSLSVYSFGCLDAEGTQSLGVKMYTRQDQSFTDTWADIKTGSENTTTFVFGSVITDDLDSARVLAYRVELSSDNILKNPLGDLSSTAQLNPSMNATFVPTFSPRLPALEAPSAVVNVVCSHSYPYASPAICIQFSFLLSNEQQNNLKSLLSTYIQPLAATEELNIYIVIPVCVEVWGIVSERQALVRQRDSALWEQMQSRVKVAQESSQNVAFWNPQLKGSSVDFPLPYALFQTAAHQFYAANLPPSVPFFDDDFMMQYDGSKQIWPQEFYNAVHMPVDWDKFSRMDGSEDDTFQDESFDFGVFPALTSWSAAPANNGVAPAFVTNRDRSTASRTPRLSSDAPFKTVSFRCLAGLPEPLHSPSSTNVDRPANRKLQPVPDEKTPDSSHTVCRVTLPARVRPYEAFDDYKLYKSQNGLFPNVKSSRIARGSLFLNYGVPRRSLSYCVGLISSVGENYGNHGAESTVSIKRTTSLPTVLGCFPHSKSLGNCIYDGSGAVVEDDYEKFKPFFRFDDKLQSANVVNQNRPSLDSYLDGNICLSTGSGGYNFTASEYRKEDAPTKAFLRLSRYSKDFKEIEVLSHQSNRVGLKRKSCWFDHLFPPSITTRVCHRIDQNIYVVKRIPWPCFSMLTFLSRLCFPCRNAELDASRLLHTSAPQLPEQVFLALQKLFKTLTLNLPFCEAGPPSKDSKTILPTTLEGKLFFLFTQELYRRILSEASKFSQLQHSSTGRIYQCWIQRTQDVVRVPRQVFTASSRNQRCNVSFQKQTKSKGSRQTADRLFESLMAMSTSEQSDIDRFSSCSSSKLAQERSGRLKYVPDDSTAELSNFESDYEFCLQMEYCRGSTLCHYIGNKNLTYRESIKAWAVFRQILEAVVLIHGEGLSHRALHPGNIVVECFETDNCSSAGFPVVKIGDIGLTQFVRRESFWLLICLMMAERAKKCKFSSGARALSCLRLNDARINNTTDLDNNVNSDVGNHTVPDPKLESVLKDNGCETVFQIPGFIQDLYHQFIKQCEPYLPVEFFTSSLMYQLVSITFMLTNEKTKTKTVNPPDEPVALCEAKAMDNIVVGDQRSDLFSLGLLLFELFHEPFRSEAQRFEALRCIAARDTTTLAEHLEALACPEAATLVLRLTDPDPALRPTAAYLLYEDPLLPPSVEKSTLRQFLYRLSSPTTQEYRKALVFLYSRYISNSLGNQIFKEESIKADVFSHLKQQHTSPKWKKLVIQGPYQLLGYGFSPFHVSPFDSSSISANQRVEALHNNKLQPNTTSSRPFWCCDCCGARGLCSPVDMKCCPSGMHFAQLECFSEKRLNYIATFRDYVWKTVEQCFLAVKSQLVDLPVFRTSVTQCDCGHIVVDALALDFLELGKTNNSSFLASSENYCKNDRMLLTTDNLNFAGQMAPHPFSLSEKDKKGDVVSGFTPLLHGAFPCWRKAVQEFNCCNGPSQPLNSVDPQDGQRKADCCTVTARVAPVYLLDMSGAVVTLAPDLIGSLALMMALACSHQNTLQLFSTGSSCFFCPDVSTAHGGRGVPPARHVTRPVRMPLRVDNSQMCVRHHAICSVHLDGPHVSTVTSKDSSCAVNASCSTFEKKLSQSSSFAPSSRLRAVFSVATWLPNYLNKKAKDTEDDHLNRLILEAEHIVSCVDALSPFSPALGRLYLVWSHTDLLSYLIEDFCRIRDPVRLGLLDRYFRMFGISVSIECLIYTIFLCPLEHLKSALSRGVQQLFQECCTQRKLFTSQPGGYAVLYTLWAKQTQALYSILKRISLCRSCFLYGSGVLTTSFSSDSANAQQNLSSESRTSSPVSRTNHQTSPSFSLSMLIDMVQEHMEDVSKVAAQLVSELAAQQSAACPSAEYQAWTPDVERALMLIRQCSDPAFKTQQLLRQLQVIETLFLRFFDSKNDLPCNNAESESPTSCLVEFDATFCYDMCLHNNNESLVFELGFLTEQFGRRPVAIGGRYDTLVQRKLHRLQQHTAALDAVQKPQPLLSSPNAQYAATEPAIQQDNKLPHKQRSSEWLLPLHTSKVSQPTETHIGTAFPARQLASLKTEAASATTVNPPLHTQTLTDYFHYIDTSISTARMVTEPHTQELQYSGLVPTSACRNQPPVLQQQPDSRLVAFGVEFDLEGITELLIATVCKYDRMHPQNITADASQIAEEPTANNTVPPAVSELKQPYRHPSSIPSNHATANIPASCLFQVGFDNNFCNDTMSGSFYSLCGTSPLLHPSSCLNSTLRPFTASVVVVIQKMIHQTVATSLTEKITTLLGLTCCLRVSPVCDLTRFRERLLHRGSVFCLIVIVSKRYDATVGYDYLMYDVFSKTATVCPSTEAKHSKRQNYSSDHDTSPFFSVPLDCTEAGLAPEQHVSNAQDLTTTGDPLCCSVGYRLEFLTTKIHQAAEYSAGLTSFHSAENSKGKLSSPSILPKTLLKLDTEYQVLQQLDYAVHRLLR